MIVVPGLGGGFGNPNTRLLPVPHVADFSWIEQYSTSAMSDGAGGLALDAKKAGAGVSGKAVIGWNAYSAGSFTATTTYTGGPSHVGLGATQAYGVFICVRDSIHGGAVIAYGIGANRDSDALNTYSTIREGWKGAPGDNGANHRTFANNIAPKPLALQVKYDGSTFSYKAGVDLSSLATIGSDSLATVRGLDGFNGAWLPNQLGLLLCNQDGFGDPFEAIFSGWKVTS